MTEKERLLSGVKPTGRPHIGNYFGAMRQFVERQDTHDCLYMVADYHALNFIQNADEMRSLTADLVLDYLSVGIDPEKATIYLQSKIPENTEIAVIFSNLVSVPRLQRVPSLKDVMRDAQIQIPSFGLLGYPVLQAADILMVKGELVPVGKDQASHIEITREIAREFNRLYGQTLPIPEALIPKDIGTLPGTDGKSKMSKSAGNVINLSDESETVKKKVMSMYTDPSRIHGNEPGNTEQNPVFKYLEAFVPEVRSSKFEIRKEELKQKYKKGTVKDVEVKQFLYEVLEKFLVPIRNRRKEFESKPEIIDKILEEGTNKARGEAKKTLIDIKKSMKLPL